MYVNFIGCMVINLVADVADVVVWVLYFPSFGSSDILLNFAVE